MSLDCLDPQFSITNPLLTEILPGVKRESNTPCSKISEVLPYWACKTSSPGDSLAGTRNSHVCRCRCYFLLSQRYEEHRVALLLPTLWGAPRATDSALRSAAVGKRQRRWVCVPRTRAVANHSSLHPRNGHEQRPSSFAAQIAPWPPLRAFWFSVTCLLKHAPPALNLSWIWQWRVAAKNTLHPHTRFTSNSRHVFFSELLQENNNVKQKEFQAVTRN